MFANRYVIWMKSAGLKSRLERSLPLCLLSVKKVARLLTFKIGTRILLLLQIRVYPRPD